METATTERVSELVEKVRAWLPRRGDPSSKISRDFWMPDHSCRVCYDCDSQFTIFNRRHHCRICGRVFCWKCTQNTIPLPAHGSGRQSGAEDRIRVCNFCFKICKQEITSSSFSSSSSSSQWNGAQLPSSSPTSSSSVSRLDSGKSGGQSGNSSTSIGSMPYPTGPYQHDSSGFQVNFRNKEASAFYEPEGKQDIPHQERNSSAVSSVEGVSSPSLLAYCISRSDDERDEYGKDLEDHHRRGDSKHPQEYFEDHGSIDLDRGYILRSNSSPRNSMDHEVHLNGSAQNGNYGKNVFGKSPSFQPDMLAERQMFGRSERSGEELEDADNLTDCNDDSAMFQSQSSEAEQPFDFENNGLIWLPPDPVDAEDEIESSMLDDDEDDDEGGWGLPRSSGSFSSSEYKNKERSSEEHREAMRTVVDGHFRALVAQLLKEEDVIVGEENDKESWLEIVTSLSWQAATFVKPDTSKGGGMDPGLYVKVKCIASGRRSGSKLVKGVICSKNVKHKRMTSKYKNPRLLLLAGALEYQRVSNQLSSLDTLLQQEMDHLKMTVARIEAHHPNVLLVEKTVSHHAQEYLLTKEISLVLNVKKPLLERIARCTGAQIIPSVDNLAAPKVGHCELFHVERFSEEHGSVGQPGKKQTKTLMFFEGCPKRLGCTVLLMGASRDELKKVKHVLQYTVFAAYHLALETSFLADEGATLPELPLKSPITVALPDKQSSIDRSISTIPGFAVPVPDQKQTNHTPSPSPLPRESLILNNKGEFLTKEGKDSSMSGFLSHMTCKSSSSSTSPVQTKVGFRAYSAEAVCTETIQEEQDICTADQRSSASLGSVSGLSASLKAVLDETVAPLGSSSYGKTTSDFDLQEKVSNYSDSMNGFMVSVAPGTCVDYQMRAEEQSSKALRENQGIAEYEMNSKLFHDAQIAGGGNQEQVPSKEDFPPSPSDHQSILVLLSSRCVLKGTVCERSQLFRIKYYGNFDKPLGSYLRDDLFDQKSLCRCNEPSEAHVLCYTHRQGSLTISVKRMPLLMTLPGEREGKIWMWHRCLKCARKDGVPEATRRVVMSDAAWGLSFGKFLELSFSNHAAASRVASCGHSLHRDCLRFYGLGSMIACFKYSSVNVLSVHLPPSKLEFNDPNQQEWLNKEASEVAHKVDNFYREIFDHLHQIGKKIASSGSLYTGTKVSESRRQIAELERFLLKQKAEHEEMLQRAIPNDWQLGKPVADILELNRLRRYLIFRSYLWDHCLRYLDASLTAKISVVNSESIPAEDVKILYSKDVSSVKELGESQVTCKDNSNTGSFGIPGIQSPIFKVDGIGLDKSNMSENLCFKDIPAGNECVMADILVQSATLNNFKKSSCDQLKETCSLNGKLDESVKPIEVPAGAVTPDEAHMGSLDHYSRGFSSVSSFDLENDECFSDVKVYEKMSMLRVDSRDSRRSSEGDLRMCTDVSERHFRTLADLSDTLDAAWTGEGQSVSTQAMLVTSQVPDISNATPAVVAAGGETAARKDCEPAQQSSSGAKILYDSLLHVQDKGGIEVPDRSTPTSPVKSFYQLDDIGSWFGASLSSLSKSYSRSFQGTASGPIRLDSLSSYTPKFISSLNSLSRHGGGRFLLPAGVNDTVFAVYDDEPTSIIAYALASQAYQVHLSDKVPDNDRHKEKEKEHAESIGTAIAISYPICSSDSSSDLAELLSRERNSGSEDIYTGSKGTGGLDFSAYTKSTHVKVSFCDDGPPGKVKYTVTCYYAKQFDALRRKCCPTEMDFRRSLSRCKKWGAQGGKSNVFFAKSLDDRFVIKQVTRTELESFSKFAAEYFKYLSDSLSSGSPTCLAKILGIYQVTVKHAKGGKEIRMDLMVMENLLFGRNVTRVYDLKGSGRSRYNSDSTGSNKVLLDQNLLESMPTAPILLGNKAKRLLERAVWNDTSFLATIDVMDYSLLVGVDEERCELVLGIIDFMRQYTWDKHLETWVKASGILGGPKNESPTIISPKQYKKRFRKAMSAYFLMVPDQWSPPAIVPSLQKDIIESGSSFLTKDDGGDQLA